VVKKDIHWSAFRVYQTQNVLNARSMYCYQPHREAMI